MNRDLNQEEIIKFVYGELSFSETASLYDRIDHEPEAIKDLEAFAELKLRLDRLKVSPSEDFEQRILDFSKSFEEENF